MAVVHASFTYYDAVISRVVLSSFGTGQEDQVLRDDAATSSGAHMGVSSRSAFKKAR